jgi:hypothetical protein
MTRYQNDIWIGAPPEAVFDYVADLTRHGEWAAQPLKVEALGGERAEGARFRTAAHQFGRDNINEQTVLDYDRPRRFAFEARGREGRFVHAFDLVAEADGTRLTKSMEVLKARLLVRLLTPVFNLTTPGIIAQDLRRIKERLERG